MSGPPPVGFKAKSLGVPWQRPLHAWDSAFAEAPSAGVSASDLVSLNALARPQNRRCRHRCTGRSVAYAGGYL